MSNALSFVELLEEIAGGELRLRRDAEDFGDLIAACVELRNGRKVLAVERSYRDGIHVIIEPTPEELEIARGGDLWKLWNSERSRLLISLLPFRETAGDDGKLDA